MSSRASLTVIKQAVERGVEVAVRRLGKQRVIVGPPTSEWDAGIPYTPMALATCTHVRSAWPSSRRR